MKRTAKSIQADIAKGAFRPHSAFYYGAGLLSAGFNNPCKEYVPGLPGRVIL